MSKAPIKSSDVAQDIRNGMDDGELMKKYGLSSTQLASVLTKLIAGNRVTQEGLDARGLILDDQPVKEVESSSIRIPVLIATCFLCSVLFGWFFLLKQQKLIHGGLDMFYQDYEGNPFDYWGFIQYILTLVALAALTVVPPILVWVWTPVIWLWTRIRKSTVWLWTRIRKSTLRFVRYKRFTARNIIGVVVGILFLVGVFYFLHWIWLMSRSNWGDASAQYDLGSMYRVGKDVPQNYSKAVDWYQKAADQGHAPGQVALGFMYERGLGVPENEKKAVDWYRQATAQGYSPAQFRLGMMYESGLGVPKNEGTAVDWYRKAAVQGYDLAQYALGTMYENGTGTPMDYKMAAFWYQKAADQGLDRAKEGLARIRAIIKQSTPTRSK